MRLGGRAIWRQVVVLAPSLAVMAGSVLAAPRYDPERAVLAVNHAFYVALSARDGRALAGEPPDNSHYGKSRRGGDHFLQFGISADAAYGFSWCVFLDI